MVEGMGRMEERRRRGGGGRGSVQCGRMCERNKRRGEMWKL